MTLKISIVLAPAGGDMKRLREAWIEADALGADRIYACDHFVHTMPTPSEGADPLLVIDKESTQIVSGKNFEATTVQAAMAATTRRAEIGCFVHCNAYRNANLMADISRTIDHISGGRFVLGIGSGDSKADFEEYGYEWGTAKDRMRSLERDLPVIKARFEKLNPKPLRPIPILIAAMGEKIGLSLVAKYADIWQAHGGSEVIAQRKEVLRARCDEIGRDPREIELSVMYVPNIYPDLHKDPTDLLKLQPGELVLVFGGPDWDLGLLREMLAWRSTLQ